MKKAVLLSKLKEKKIEMIQPTSSLLLFNPFNIVFHSFFEIIEEAVCVSVFVFFCVFLLAV